VRGELAAETSDANLPGTQGIVITLVEMPAEDLDYGLRALDPEITREGRRITIPVNTPALQARLLQLLLDEGFTIASLQPTLGTLRDLYLHVVTGNSPPVEATPQVTMPLLDTLLAEEENQ
jgi:ABC-2 type transport system ATP-binding protein